MVSLKDIKNVSAQFPKEVVRTPLLTSNDLSDSLRCKIFLKAENLQVTGSYKSRAAFAILNNLTGEQKKRGAAISSSGNFAGGFSFMGRLLRIPVTVVMMQKTAPFKIEKCKRYGANVVLCENRFEARWETLDRLQNEDGITAINTFEDPEVIAGHASIGLEILAQNAGIDIVLVPISSGGLLAGIATSIKETNPNIKVIGIQPEGSNAMFLSFQKGSLQTIEQVDTICDALIATTPGKLPFEHVQKYVDDVILVTEDSVKKAVGLLFETTKMVVEPSGAVGIAALLSGKIEVHGEKIVSLLSGGNISKNNYVRILGEA